MQLLTPAIPQNLLQCAAWEETQDKAAPLEAGGCGSSPQELAQQHLVWLRWHCLSQHPLQNIPEGCEGARAADYLPAAGRLGDCLGLQHREAPWVAPL